MSESRDGLPSCRDSFYQGESRESVYNYDSSTSKRVRDEVSILDLENSIKKYKQDIANQVQKLKNDLLNRKESLQKEHKKIEEKIEKIDEEIKKIESIDIENIL